VQRCVPAHQVRALRGIGQALDDVETRFQAAVDGVGRRPHADGRRGRTQVHRNVHEGIPGRSSVRQVMGVIAGNRGCKRSFRG